MVKAANVTIVSRRRSATAWSSVVIQGDVGAVKAATEAGAETASSVGELIVGARDPAPARRARQALRRPVGVGRPVPVTAESRVRAAGLPADPETGPAVRRLPGHAHPCPRLPADRGRERPDRRGVAGACDRAHHRPGAAVGARGRAGHPLRRAPVRRARGAPRRSGAGGSGRRRHPRGHRREARGCAASAYPLRRRDRATSPISTR